MSNLVTKSLPRAKGFVQNIGTIQGNSVVIPRFASNVLNPDRIIQTLSVWQDLESIAAFAYSGLHAKALREKFTIEKKWPSFVAWWIDNDLVPQFTDGTQRLEHLYDHGATPYAFNLKNCFDAEGKAIQLNRQAANN